MKQFAESSVGKLLQKQTCVLQLHQPNAFWSGIFWTILVNSLTDCFAHLFKLLNTQRASVF